MYKKIYVEITNACNLSCDFCIKNQRELKFMSEKEFKIILEKLKNHTKYLYFHVLGEPLMHPKINEFINLASLSYKVNITTNGYLIEKIKNNKNIRQLNISLHSYNSKYNINLDDYLNHIFEVVDTLENTFISYRLWVDSSNVDKILNRLNEKYNTSLSKNSLKKNNIKKNQCVFKKCLTCIRYFQKYLKKMYIVFLKNVQRVSKNGSHILKYTMCIERKLAMCWKKEKGKSNRYLC